MKRRNILLVLTLLALAMPWAANAQTRYSGSGTSGDPYLITSASDWNTFADAVNNTSENYEGKYFKLMDDISVTKTVSSNHDIWLGFNDYQFAGHFDGNGHTITITATAGGNHSGLFNVINHASIKNLKVEGSIDGNGKDHIGGIVGGANTLQGDCVIENCWSNVTITNTNNYNSGIVAHCVSSNRVTVRGCIFTGKLKGTGQCVGGMFGEQQAAYTTFEDCVFAPSEITMDVASSSTFVSSSPTLTRCYYYTDASFGTTQGTQAYSVALAATPAAGGTVDGGTPTTNYGFIKAYSNGLLCDGIYYANGSVSLKATANEGYTFSQWTDSNIDNPRSITVSADASYTAKFSDGSEELTVYANSATNSYIPMYGNWFDNYTKSECIIPATELTEMNGGTITAISFYPSNKGSHSNTWTNTHQIVFLKEVSGTTLGGSYSGTSGATTVKEGSPLPMPTVGLAYTITFDTPYTYEGGDLLIGVYNDNPGTYNSVTWYGTSGLSSGVSAYGYNSTSLENVSYNAQSFLPKTTFTYTLPFYNITLTQPSGGTISVSVAGGPSTTSSTTAAAGKTVTLTASPNSGYTFDSWSVTGVTGTASGNTYTFTMPSNDVSVTATIPITTIASVANWNTFCSTVNGGYDYTGKTVTMTANVSSVSNMCGTVTVSGDVIGPDKCFSGTFDGGGNTLDVSISNSTDQGTAPFRSISNATIRNLRVTGSVISTTHGSGLVGFVKGGTTNNNIINCRIGANVSSGSAHNAGVVGHAKTATVNLTGCIYDGEITCSGNYTGGFVGWGDNGHVVHLTNCLFNGTKSGSNSFHPIGCCDGNKASSSSSVTNCYYYATNGAITQIDDDHTNSIVKNISGNKGKRAYALSLAVSPIGSGTVSHGNPTDDPNNPYTVSGITYYSTGIDYNSTFYAGSGDVIPLTATANGSNEFNEWTVSGAGTSVANASSASTNLTMGTATATATANFDVPTQTIPYTETFESSHGWTEVNGEATNKWYCGSPGAHGGSNGYYISSDGGTTNAYSTSSISVVYIYKLLDFEETGTYKLSFDLRQQGESTWDCVGAMLYSEGTTPTASTSSAGSGLTTWPSGYAVMIGGAGTSASGGNWVTSSFYFVVEEAGNYNLVLAWKNDSSGGSQPPASIDNVSVVYAPSYSLSFSADPSIGGTVAVTETLNGSAVTSGSNVQEGSKLTITATPAEGYQFNGWTVSGTGASVVSASNASTTLTMGSASTTLTANFIRIYPITWSNPANGTISVKKGGSTVSSGTAYPEGTEFNIVATPNVGYAFSGWTVTSGTLGDASSASTTFTMGAANAELSAGIEEWTLSIATTPPSTECLASGTEVVMTASPNATVPNIGDFYGFVVASDTYSSISEEASVVSSVSGDESTSSIPLGFTFNYCGADYTTAVIATNGYLKFVGGSGNGYNNDLGSTSYYNILAAFWDDLFADHTYYITTGDAPNRVFVMQFNGYVYGDSSHTFTYQIKLYETTGIIEFCYGAGFPDVSSSSASIGLNNRVNNVTTYISVTPTGSGTATTSTSASDNSIGATQCGHLASGTIYRFTPIFYTWTYTGTAGTASGISYTASPTVNSTYTATATINGIIKSHTVSVNLPDPTPTGLTVSDITGSGATVSWDEGSASSWQYSINGGSTWETVETNSVDLTGLTSSTTYTFQVKTNSTCPSEAASEEFTTLTTYTITTAASPAAGGTITGGGTYDSGSEITLTATPTDDTWIFYKWSDGTTTNPRTITVTANATYTAYFAPLTISNADEWGYFSDAVNDGFTYSGLTVTMTADVGTAGDPVSTMVGVRDPARYFCGTFVGGCYTLTFSKSVSEEYCAPFRRINGATIRNLKTAGNISISSGRFAAGIVAYTTGSSTITNCSSSMVITSTVADDAACAGIVGQCGGTNITTLSGCVFNGEMKGGKNNWGGLVGYFRTNGTVRISDCLFAPESITVGTGCYTIARNRGEGVEEITNCYYNEEGAEMSTKQGTQAYTLDMVASPAAGGTVSHAGSGTEYGCSGITAYTTGLAYDIDNDAADELLLGDGESATITASANSGYTFMNWTDGSNTPIVNPYAVTMGAANHTVTAHFVQQNTPDTWVVVVDEYSDVPSGGFVTDANGNVTISNEEGLAWLISNVNALNGCPGNSYNEHTVTLTTDINADDLDDYIWVPIGTAEHPFAGTFNGNGHTISGITRSDAFPYQGLFGYVEGGTIHDVVVNTTLTGNSNYSGGVAGYIATGSKVYNTGSTGTVSAPSDNNTIAVGGTVGYNAGLVHSSFATGTFTGSAGDYVGGLVGENATTGRLYNSYSNATLSAGERGGLVGYNKGTTANCYNVNNSGTYAYVNKNAGTVEYVYSDNTNEGYYNAIEGSPTLQHHGSSFSAVQSDIKHLDYMYRDNAITLAGEQTSSYVPSSVSYDNNHTVKWNGLVSALNQWVADNRTSGVSISDLSSWYRPHTTNINGDLPVLGFGGETTLGAANGSPKTLKYGTMDDLLTTYSGGTASIFHYGKATGVTHVPTADVNVYIDEDAVLLQATNPDPGPFINTTVGVTFDNSDHGTHAYDYWGNKLNYDWHLLSTPLSDLNTGAVHSNYTEGTLPNSQVDITNIGGYFPDGLITSGNPAVGGTIKWDFYTYYEPEYHWINLKRNKNNHIHQDGGAPIHYNQNDQDTDGSSAYYIPGKGYEMAINQVTYMNATGTLNRGNVPITLTNSEPDDINYAKGWNLVGNPYQAYLDIAKIGYDHIYTYDADQGTFVPYTTSASENPEIVSQYIHPHQAFFVHASSNNEELLFTQTMATTDTESGSYFRDDKVNYPLVNLFAEDGAGHRDLTVIEFHRPELGGAPKLDYMRTSPFSLAAHHAGKSYGILFVTDDIERVPVKFKPSDDGLITLTWITHNGEFSKLLLIDNKLGVEHNMLADNSYTFEASPDDYSSRFYIVYDCSGMGVEENDENGASTGSATAATFAYINNGNIVIDIGSGHGASIQVIDVLGRVLYSKTIAGTNGTCTVSTKGLAKGVYLIRLADGHNVKTQKLVVQ